MILRVMALKGAANNVLEITRALVDRKESDTSFKEMNIAETQCERDHRGDILHTDKKAISIC